MALVAANFHYIRDDFAAPFPSIFGVTPAQFRAQLEELSGAGDFVGAADIVAALDGERALPQRAIAITFDDGLAEQFELAWPILQKLRIPAVFFVNTACIEEGRVETVHKVHILRSRISPPRILDQLAEFAAQSQLDLAAFDTGNATLQYKYDAPDIARLKYLLNFALTNEQRDRFVDGALQALTGFDERKVSRSLYLSPRQARELDAYGALGSHGHRHLVLGRMPAEAAEHEVRASAEVLSAWGCRNVMSFSYPSGSLEACSADAARAAAATGIRFAFTMERAANVDLQQPMFLARFANNDLPGGSAPLYTAANLFRTARAARWHRGETILARA